MADPNLPPRVPPQSVAEQRVADVASEAATNATEAVVREARFRIYRRFAILFALPMALIALIPSMVGLAVLDHEMLARCNDARINRDGLRSTLIDGLDSVGLRLDAETGEITDRGLDGSLLVPIDYYVEHPEELDDRQAEVTVALSRFPTVDCSNAGLFR